MEKRKIEEVIVVEGRDDTAAVKRAIDGLTIETHGFGIRRETWALIEKAYREKGIIIFTDPDYAGEEIRRRLTKQFPDAKQAFLSREYAQKKDDIGIENAESEAILEAIEKAHATFRKEGAGEADLYTAEDLFAAGLSGGADSKQRREKLGQVLGIGYANARGLRGKLNQFGIRKEEFYEAIRTIDHSGD
mgnify:FL=1